MVQFNAVIAGLCFGVGVIGVLSGDYILGGINLFLAVLNYKAANHDET